MPMNTHEWCGFPASDAGGGLDAENRLVAVTITATGHRSEFGYDGLGRRVEIIEKDPDATQTLQITSDKRYLWDGVEIAEERDATGGIVQKRFYSQGFVDTDGTILFYTRDHLGSIRELTDNTQAVRARFDYDPYGRMTKVQGDKDSPFTYTGHFWHAQSGLNLTLFRAYDPDLGRWISRDPIGEVDNFNLYSYVWGDPINLIDNLGLEVTMTCRPISGLGKIGIKKPVHCAVFVWHWEKDCKGNRHKVIDAQYSIPGGADRPTSDPDNSTFVNDRNAFNNPGGSNTNNEISLPDGMTQSQFDQAVIQSGNSYQQGPYPLLPWTGPNSNTGANNIIERGGGVTPLVPGAAAQDYGPSYPKNRPK